jgi:rhodanese-related sulfurtransferase
MPLIQLLALLSLAAVTQTAKTRTTMEHTTDTLAVVKDNVSKGKAVLVDVRSLTEWKQGNIEGAIFLPVTTLGKDVDVKSLAKTLPKDKILYTFCAVGVRSKAAALKLQELGYPVRALKPGYDDLIKAGFKQAKIAVPEKTPAGK